MITLADIDVATATPAELDTILFPALAERYQYAEWAFSERKRIAKAIWPVEFKAAGYETRSRSHVYAARHEYDLRSIGESVQQYQAKIDEAQAIIDVIDGEFDRRGGWTRYVLVGGGHLHRHQYCSSLRPTTRILLLAESSGLTDEEVVAKYTYTACTKCFPNAPVETKADPNTCPGSGKYVENVKNDQGRYIYGRYVPCPECGEFVTRNANSGLTRKHTTGVK